MPVFSDISTSGNYNIGGINRLVFIPVDDVDSIPFDQDFEIQNEINLLPGKVWFTIEVTLGTLSFVEEEQASESGSYWKQELSGIVPKDRIEAIRSFDKMRAFRFIVLFQDNNNLVKVLGSKDFPVRFKSSSSSGAQTKDRNSHKFSFYSNSINKAFVYHPYFDFNFDFNTDFDA